MSTSSSLAVVLLMAGLLHGRAALGVPADATPAEAIGSVERIGRGQSFAADTVVFGASGSLAQPQFDPSAGFSGGGGIQPARPNPGNLSGSYSGPPTMRELSASVMVADAFASADGVSAPVASRAATFLSAGTAAADPFDPYRGAGAGGSKAAVTGVAEEAAIARHSLSLIPSSVFVNGNSGTAAPSAAPRSSGIGSAALRTVQAGSSLTIYQALHTTATDPDAALPPNGTIEAYTLIPPTAATPGRASATMLRVPMKVTSSSYGFLNSSLTVFSDEFGSFAGIGQTFNGLTSLNIDEPPAIAIVGLGLLGLAAIRRCLKRS